MIPMAGIYAQVTLQPRTGNTEDVQVNGFAADTTAPGFADFDDWVTTLLAFYMDVFGIFGLSGIAQNGHIVKFYDITGSAPNYPVYESGFNLTTAGRDTDLPLEVALAVSYANTVNNSVARARRRGRIYLSGWTKATTTAGRPTAATFEGLSQAYADYVLALNALGPFEAGVWSRMDDTVYPIDQVWCDNEWDTVRRRGGKPTVRDTINV